MGFIPNPIWLQIVTRCKTKLLIGANGVSLKPHLAKHIHKSHNLQNYKKIPWRK